MPLLAPSCPILPLLSPPCPILHLLSPPCPILHLLSFASQSARTAGACELVSKRATCASKDSARQDGMRGAEASARGGGRPTALEAAVLHATVAGSCNSSKSLLQPVLVAVFVAASPCCGGPLPRGEPPPLSRVACLRATSRVFACALMLPPPHLCSGLESTRGRQGRGNEPSARLQKGPPKCRDKGPSSRGAGCRACCRSPV